MTAETAVTAEGAGAQEHRSARPSWRRTRWVGIERRSCLEASAMYTTILQPQPPPSDCLRARRAPFCASSFHPALLLLLQNLGVGWTPSSLLPTLPTPYPLFNVLFTGPLDRFSRAFYLSHLDRPIFPGLEMDLFFFALSNGFRVGRGTSGGWKERDRSVQCGEWRLSVYI